MVPTRLVALSAACLLVAFTLGASCSDQGVVPNPIPPTGPPRVFAVGPSGTVGVTGANLTFAATIAGGATSHQWEFGGGATPNTSTAESPTVALGAPGDYLGSLIVANAEGAAPLFRFAYTVAEAGGATAPQVSAVTPTGNVGVSDADIVFAATTTGGAPTSWSWEFGSGATPSSSTEESPEVTLGAIGSYTGRVTATNAVGSSAPFVFDYAVFDPALELTIDAVHPQGFIGGVGQASHFVVETTPAAGNDVNWTFGGGLDSTSSPAVTPYLTLTSAGTFTGSVHVRNEFFEATQSFTYTIGAAQWPAAFGIADVDARAQLFVGADGSTFALGRFSNTADFDPGPGEANATVSTSANYLVKLGPDGTLAWFIAWEPDTVTWEHLYLAPGGDLWLSGSYTDAVDLDPGAGSLIPEIDLGGTAPLGVALRINASGQVVQLLSGILGALRVVDTSDSGGLIAGGYFNLLGDVDPGPATINLEPVDFCGEALCGIFLELDASGNLIAQAPVDGLDPLRLGDDGNLYTINTPPNIAAAEPIRVRRYGRDGTQSGDIEWAGDGLPRVWDFHVDFEGRAFTLGDVRIDPDFEPGPGVTRIGTGEERVYLQILNSDLALEALHVVEWAGGPTDGRYAPRLTRAPLGVHWDVDGFFTVACALWEEAGVGLPGGLTVFTPAARDAFLMTFDATGEVLVAQQWGSATADTLNDVVRGPDGRLWTLGSYGALADLAPGAEVAERLEVFPDPSFAIAPYDDAGLLDVN